MNQYICSDFYNILLSEYFLHWRLNLNHINQEFIHYIRSAIHFGSPSDHTYLYIGGTDNIYIPLCYRSIDTPYQINHFQFINPCYLRNITRLPHNYHFSSN
jgi:hypothetical protein